MLHKVKELVGDAIAASDGEIGRVDQVYFDDENWRVRYLVVDTGGWLAGRKVLIPPVSIDPSKSSENAIAVRLTREQVEHSPDIDTDMPVSRQYEAALDRYYDYSLFSAPPEESALSAGERAAESGRTLQEAERKASASHLRASSEVIGYSIRATDGAVGHVDDLMVDDANWAIADLVVDPRDWLPGKKVLVAPSAVEGIDWQSKEVRLRMPRREIHHA